MASSSNDVWKWVAGTLVAVILSLITSYFAFGAGKQDDVFGLAIRMSIVETKLDMILQKLDRLTGDDN